MNLRKKNLILIFIIACLFSLITPVLLSNFHLMFFVPFIITAYYQKKLSTCLWLSFFCGLILDLLTMQSPFGFYAFNYSMTTTILYSQRRNFFSDHISTLPIMTFLFCIIATFLQVIFLYLAGHALNIGMGWILTDLFIMPFADALFGFILFILIPQFILKKPKRRTI